ncbi:putative secreted protein [Xanthomonas bromi]|uniref:Putative secreted protein n=1 Tax=Xanthomonas bromi TaxID=56449 RepID=A0A1C3NSF7_9XANT|nr:hypothetical protein [Xanthomonas bromi]SBV53339.1 putative secreted protein [Xanthomonas bromi]
MNFSLRTIIFSSCLCFATSCSAAAPTKNLRDSLQAHCEATQIDEHIVLRVVKGKQISACPPDAEEGCPYNANHGQTYLVATPDLNQDGRTDAIIRYLGSNYGDTDAVDYLVLTQCKDGTYIRALEGAFSDLKAPDSIVKIWPDLTATRVCPTPDNTGSVTTELSLHFDPKSFKYFSAPDSSLESPCN